MTRALVLGGGGPMGIGWESGLAVGLAEGGIDLAAADAIYGTSAGSFVGAQLALGFDIAETAELLIETSAAAMAANTGPPVTAGLQALTDVVTAALNAGTPAEEVRRLLGRLALEAPVVTEDEFLDLFGVFRGHPWPDGFSCTALDTATADFVVWQAPTDVELHRAVASSCAVPMVCPPITIGGRRFMDGGVRSPLNADLARGHDRVLVVSVTVLARPPEPDGLTGDGPDDEFLLAGIADEISTLRSSGATVEVIEPNAEFLEVSGWGTTLMDVGKAAQAYAAGVRQGLAESRRIANLWGVTATTPGMEDLR
ncbi:MAG TPA: patatin-like phospholipase family protein [Acidimicrobiales bacterium]|nr:patatin-like phospholipase family protein [Acidimicrobiales bacterium]